MKYVISLLVLVGTWSMGAVAAQEPQPGAPVGTLTPVRLTQPVLANGKTLPAGLYELRITNERPTPLPGQSPEAERWVEFVANGTVAAREVATVLRDDELPATGASSAPTRAGTRVELLKGGEFVRVSVRQGGERYLIYLPVAP